jgi:hypothetical protein
MTRQIRNLLAGVAVLFIFSCERLSPRATNSRADELHVTPMNTSDVTIIKVWELPQELVEISANVLIDEQRMACIQDNAGTIYIYNLTSKAIEQKIVFTGKGDFESLVHVGNTFYALRADGHLYKISPGTKAEPVVETFDLPLSVENDTESMFYDATANRLLIGVKEKNRFNANTPGKEVYAFDLKTNTMSPNPVFTIEEPGDTTTPDVKTKGKKKDRKFKPSEIAMHPSTRELYILNGPLSTLLVADNLGKVKKQYQLDKQLFPQPEGLCFSDSGELYLSSEGGNHGRGIIALVKLAVQE